MVPGIIVATYRNRGGEADDEMIRTAIRRGGQVPGGYCGYVGICGAAVGVGIGFGVLLDANPVKARERQIVQTVTHAALADIAALTAPRCCQRDAWLALTSAAASSREHLPVELTARAELSCSQSRLNSECIGSTCPLWPAKRQA